MPECIVCGNMIYVGLLCDVHSETPDDKEQNEEPDSIETVEQETAACAIVNTGEPHSAQAAYLTDGVK